MAGIFRAISRMFFSAPEVAGLLAIIPPKLKYYRLTTCTYADWNMSFPILMTPIGSALISAPFAT